MVAQYRVIFETNFGFLQTIVLLIEKNWIHLERLAASAAMNMNPLNLNPAHVPAQVVSINEVMSSTSSSNSSVRIPYYLIRYYLNGNFI
jgi:hypothetical protein